MTTFLVKFHFPDHIERTEYVDFKWYERITTERILKKFFKQINSYRGEYGPVYFHDIHSINLVL